ncbi:MAG: family peptidase [Myxococcaceae bacterium]|nr:family peptidase [Myxococcaceae bacterium]
MHTCLRSVLSVAPAALLAVVTAVACGSSDGDGGGGPGTGPGGTSGGPGGPGSLPTANGTCPHDLSMAPGTATNGLSVPAAHPRLWWTTERLARAKTWLAAHPQEPRDDDFTGQIFIHAVSGADDCSKAITWAMGFTVPDSDFDVASDQLRFNGEQAAMVYDWCFDKLTSDQKTTLATRWNGYVARAADLSWGGHDMPENNYFWGYLRNEIEWGIITQQEHPDADKLLAHGLGARWKDSFLPFAQATSNGDGRGGVPQEGSQYGAYMTDYPVAPFVTASLYGRSVYDETDYFKATVFYLLYATTPGLTTSAVDGNTGYEMFPFNDDEAWQERNSAARFADFMTQAGISWGCLPVGKYARQWSAVTGAAPSPYVAAVDQGGDALDYGKLPLDYYAPGPRYFYGRNVWGATATAFHWQMGDYATAGVGHTHKDFGNWQIWRGGRWLSRESTGYSDTYTDFGGTGSVDSDATVAHNTVLVNGQGFADPSDMGVDGPTVVRRLESQADYAYADVDLTKSYRNSDMNHPDRDNPAVSHVEREFVFLRGLETTVILDRVASNAVGGKTAEAVTKSFLAHFEKAPVVEDPNHVTYTSDAQALRLTVLVPAAPTTRVIDEKSAKGSSNGQFRLEVVTSGAAQSYFLTVLQAKDAGAPALAPTVADDGTNFTVTLDGTHSVVFAKGPTSSAGSVTINGAAKNFRADVQPIKVTDSGPVWQ